MKTVSACFVRESQAPSLWMECSLEKRETKGQPDCQVLMYVNPLVYICILCIDREDRKTEIEGMRVGEGGAQSRCRRV